MKTKGHLTLKVFALLILNDFLDALAQLWMKQGLDGIGIVSVNFQNLAEFSVRCLSSWYIWAGILVYVISFVLWLIIIYRIDLSIALPVGSTVYIFIPIMAMVFLHERVSPLRWLGIAFIILGIHFVSQSKKEPA